jgi:hypothetical protein
VVRLRLRLPLKTKKRRSDRVSLDDMNDSSGSEVVNERWAESGDSNEAGGTFITHIRLERLMNGTSLRHHGLPYISRRQKPANMGLIPFHTAVDSSFRP